MSATNSKPATNPARDPASDSAAGRPAGAASTPERQDLAAEIDALELERICALGWPGLIEAHLGDWLLRFGDGFTGRANSVLVLGEPGMPFDDAVQRVSDWYAGHLARPMFQIPIGPAVPARVSDVGRLLTDRGWSTGNETVVLTAPIGPALESAALPPELEVVVQAAPSPEWLATYVYRGRPLPDPAVRVLLGGPDPVFVTVRRERQVVAVARGVVTHGWLGVTAVTVVESARRTGIGTAAMAAVLRWGRQQQARSVYLQVDRQNTGALAMYAGLGFHEHHGYTYRHGQ